MARADQPNVILVTLDGVRWQEVFGGTDSELDYGSARKSVFDHLQNEAKNGRAVLFGGKKSATPMVISNTRMLSLPGYQSIFAGREQPCMYNDCGRIRTETFIERIARELGLNQKEVAVFASWEPIAHAASSKDNKVLVNTGIQPHHDSEGDDELATLNKMQAEELPPWKEARLDKYTFGQAFRYLKKHRPRFLFIGLDDSDEWAHAGDYNAYIRALRTHDGWIALLEKTLGEMGDYGANTTLIVTTDHGRGYGYAWKHHNPYYREAKYVWLYAKGPNVRSDVEPREYCHADIRPTIERLFGLAPLSGNRFGRAIEAIAP